MLEAAYHLPLEEEKLKRKAIVIKLSLFSILSNILTAYFFSFETISIPQEHKAPLVKKDSMTSILWNDSSLMIESDNQSNVEVDIYNLNEELLGRGKLVRRNDHVYLDIANHEAAKILLLQKTEIILNPAGKKFKKTKKTIEENSF